MGRDRFLILCIGCVLGVSGVAAAAPRVDVKTNVRYAPPEEEARTSVSVEGVRPNPLVVEAYAMFDREGNLGRPEALIRATVQGQGVEYRERYEESDDPNPFPTDGMVTQLVESTLDEVCNGTGLC